MSTAKLIAATSKLIAQTETAGYEAIVSKIAAVFGKPTSDESNPDTYDFASYWIDGDNCVAVQYHDGDISLLVTVKGIGWGDVLAQNTDSDQLIESFMEAAKGKLTQLEEPIADDNKNAFAFQDLIDKVQKALE